MLACAILLGLALLAATLLHLISNHIRLTSIPGPFIASVSGIWQLTARGSNEYGHLLAEWHQKYGDVVRLGPGTVSLSNPTDIAKVYHTKIAEETRHSEEHQRSIYQALSQDEVHVDDTVQDFVRAIQNHRTIDMTTSLHLLADELITQTPSVCESTARRQTRPRPSPSLFEALEEFLLRGPVSLLKRERMSCCGLSSEISDPAVLRGTEADLGLDQSSELALHDSVLVESLESIKKTFILAFTFLLKYPRVLRKLRTEIDYLPRPRNSATVPCLGASAGARYLEAVLQETLRLAMLRNNAIEICRTNAPITVISKHIPPGTLISWHPFVVLANQSIFGDDPDVFRPERWITPGRDQLELMEKSLLPFSICRAERPEVDEAWLRLRKTVVTVLREFDDKLILTQATDVALCCLSGDLRS